MKTQENLNMLTGEFVVKMIPTLIPFPLFAFVFELEAREGFGHHSQSLSVRSELPERH